MDQGAESMAPLSLRVHRRGLVTELTLEEATPGVTEDTSGSVGKLSFTGPPKSSKAYREGKLDIYRTWRIIPFSKSPKDRVILLPNGLFMAYKWGLANHLLTGMILQVSTQAQFLRPSMLPWRYGWSWAVQASLWSMNNPSPGREVRIVFWAWEKVTNVMSHFRLVTCNPTN